MAPVDNTPIVLSASVTGSVRVWDANAAHAVCPVDPMQVSMVSAKPRGPSIPQQPKPSKLEPKAASSGETACEYQNTLDRPIAVKPVNNEPEVDLEALVDGTMHTADGTMVASSQVVRAVVQRLHEIELALEDQKDTQSACTADQLEATQLAAAELDTRLTTLQTQCAELEKPDPEQAKIVQDIQRMQLELSERLNGAQSAPDQLPSHEAIEAALEQTSRQNSELESQCTWAEQHSRKLTEQLQSVHKTFEAKFSTEQQQAAEQIKDLDERLGQLRAEMELHSAGNSAIDTDGVIAKVEEMQAACDSLQTEAASATSCRVQFKIALDLQKTEQQRWTETIDQRVEQLEKTMEGQQQDFAGLSGQAAEAAQVMDEAQEQFERVAELAERIDRAWACTESHQDAYKALEITLLQLQQDRSRLEDEFSTRIEEATGRISDQQAQLAELIGFPEQLAAVIPRAELVGIEEAMQLEQDRVGAACHKTETVQLELDQMLRESNGAAERALEEVRELSTRCEEIKRDASSWRQLIDMRIQPLEDADRRFRPMLERMVGRTI